VSVAEESAADAEDHRPVAGDEGGERGAVPARGEALQQVGVGGFGGRVVGPAQVPQQGPDGPEE
jgi:hypothetical protein